MGPFFLLSIWLLFLLNMTEKKEFKDYELLGVSEEEWEVLPLRDRGIMYYENWVRVTINRANRSILFNRQVESLWKKITKIKRTKDEKRAFNSLKYAKENIAEIQRPEGYVNSYNDFLKNSNNFFKLIKVDGYYQYERVNRDEVHLLQD